MPFFTHDDIVFYYEINGEGLPFLALHGLGGNLNQPKQYFEQLTGIQLITFDFRGHGRSVWRCNNKNGNIASFATDAVALLDHLRIERALVGGISLGAAVSLRLALTFPERLHALAMIRPAWLNQAFPQNLKSFTQISRMIQKLGLEKAEDQFYESKELQVIKNFYPNAAASLMGQFSRPQALQNALLLESLVSDTPFDHFDELENIACPTLVVSTKHDPLHPYDFGPKLAGAIPKAIFTEAISRYVNVQQHIFEVTEAAAKFVRLSLK